MSDIEEKVKPAKNLKTKKSNMIKAKNLDKYYTKDEVAIDCLEEFLPLVDNHTKLIEPSAGGGSFIRAAVAAGREITGFDILPEYDGVIELDFLSNDIKSHVDINNVAFIGNPPFGKKGGLAIQFINKCLKYSGTVGFILPLQFRKWSAQKQINVNARLIIDKDLDSESFEFNGKPYKVRCSFQVWSTEHPEKPDLRILLKPAISHPDFEMWQYNRTKAAEKFFDYDWDFAVPRQGFYDYSIKVYNKEECDRKKQWIFFKAKTSTALEKLKALDFEALSKKNSGTPGFGKADVVQEYTK